jgi:hypothetical protein
MADRTVSRPVAIALLVGVVAFAAIAAIAVASWRGPADADAAREAAKVELRGYLEDIAGADLVRFDVHDDRHYRMEPGAIVSAPDGGFASAYWVVLDAAGTVAVELATSPDLVHWTWRATLAEEATQPTIEPASDGGWVVGWETEPPDHLQFAWYANWDDLLSGTRSRFLDVPMTLTSTDCAEGTPSLYSASSTALDVGFHFFDRCEVDRPARGTTDWVTWSASSRPEYEAAFRQHGLAGGVGDRDDIAFRGFDFTVQEGQAVWEHYETFRVYLYDDAIGVAEPLDMRTPAGCVAFVNPTVELIEYEGDPAVVITAFVPGEAGRDCEAGPMLYVHRLDD